MNCAGCGRPHRPERPCTICGYMAPSIIEIYINSRRPHLIAEFVLNLLSALHGNPDLWKYAEFVKVLAKLKSIANDETPEPGEMEE